MKFSMKAFFSKCDQVAVYRGFCYIYWRNSYWKTIENFCAVCKVAYIEPRQISMMKPFCENTLTRHKKWSFQLRISSVNVTKEILNGKLHFLCSVNIYDYRKMRTSPQVVSCNNCYNAFCKCVRYTRMQVLSNASFPV